MSIMKTVIVFIHNNCFHSSLIFYITFQGCRVNPSLILNVLCSGILVLCSHEDPGESGMITICTEYECEVKESQKKPDNLLDALEQGGHCSGEDRNPVTGEVALETVCFHSFFIMLFALSKEGFVENNSIYST